MDPTTKEGRAALRGCHIAMQREHDIAKEEGRTPSSAPQVRWLTAAADHMLAALSRLDQLDEVLAEVRAERDKLRAELERAREAMRDVAEFATGNEVFHSSGLSPDKVVTQFKIAMKHIRETAGRAALANPSETPNGSAAIDPTWLLPCDVRLPPSTTIRKGCSLSALLTGLRAREGKDWTFSEPAPKPQAVTDEMVEVLRETLRDLGNGSVSRIEARAGLVAALRRTP